MQCPACLRPMRPIFTSYACDYCDGLIELEYDSGFIVLQGEHQLGEEPFYVFRTRTDAALWRGARGLKHCPIVEVLSEHPILWRNATGSLDVVIANQPFTIFPNRRFPPGPYRAFLAREAVPAVA
jgi:hypothetical protein